MTGPVVVDTSVFGAELAPPTASIAERYEPHLSGRPAVISFVTPAELRYGAVRARWGELKLRRLERLIAGATIVWPDERLINTYVDLRVECARIGHGLAGKIHEADRWVAASALWLRIPPVAHDRIFTTCPSDFTSMVANSSPAWTAAALPCSPLQPGTTQATCLSLESSPAWRIRGSL